MIRRARSYLELPERLGNCRSPQDLAVEQVRFWQTFYQDYAEGAQRLTLAWTAMARQTFSPNEGNGLAREVTFPESEPDRKEGPERGGRRAA
jgi:hypothetical protein